MEEKKKGKSGLVIALIIVILLLVVVILAGVLLIKMGYLSFGPKQAQQTETQIETQTEEDTAVEQTEAVETTEVAEETEVKEKNDVSNKEGISLGEDRELLPYDEMYNYIALYAGYLDIDSGLYKLLFINDDDIPELIVYYESLDMGFLYTIIDGEVWQCNDLVNKEMTYVPYGNAFTLPETSLYAPNYDVVTKYYKLNMEYNQYSPNSSLVEQIGFSYKDENNGFPLYYVNEEFNIANNITVTAEQYDEYILSFGRFISPHLDYSHMYLNLQNAYDALYE